MIGWVFDRYGELASKSNVEYIAGGNVSYNMLYVVLLSINCTTW
jgi:hypothetical protein